MAASERLVGACARYAKFAAERFRSASRRWFKGRPGADVEEKTVKPGFSKLWSETQEDWTSLAADSLRRWKVPEHRGAVEDMRQELAIGALKALRRYCPGRGPTMPEYLVWNAMAYAKKRLHKMRGAKLSGNSGKNPSRIDTLFSSMGEEREDGDFAGPVEVAMLRSGMAEEQPAVVEFRDRRDAMRAGCEDEVDDVVVEVVFGGRGLDEAARVVYGDSDLCLVWRVGSEGEARRLVGLAAAVLVDRADEQAEVA